MTVHDIARIETEVSEYWTEVLHVESTGSTNADLVEWGKPGQVLIADKQSGGRGRLGRVWEAPAGANLLMSVAVELTHTEDLGLASLATGLAVTDIVPSAKLKWPNDVLLGGKKFVGILGEIDFNGEPKLVMGIGINVAWRAEDLPTDWSTALNLEGIDIEWDAFTIDLLRAMGERLEQWQEQDPAILSDYEAVSATIGQNVHIETATGIVEGFVEGIDKYGEIIVNGTSYATGDVTHLRPAE